MGHFRTVLGDVEADKIGITYTHEHVYCNPHTAKEDPTLAITNIESSIEELKSFKEAGGSALVEGTVIDYGRNPEKMAYASEKSGVHLIATTGYYLYNYHPEKLLKLDAEAIAEKFIQEIQQGMDKTGIRAGQINA